jgi:hypothetical protein
MGCERADLRDAGVCCTFVVDHAVFAGAEKPAGRFVIRGRTSAM